MLCADVRAPAHIHHTSMPERNHIDDHSFHGHAPSKPVPDGLLPVHPPSFLVLRECGQGRVILPLVVGHSSQAALTDKPATLRASTSMMTKCSEPAMRPSTDVILNNGACGALSSGTLGMGPGVVIGIASRPSATPSPSLAESRTARRIRDRPAAAGPSPEGPQ